MVRPILPLSRVLVVQCQAATTSSCGAVDRLPALGLGKVQTLHRLLTSATWHVYVRGTGAIQLYIQLAPWQYTTDTFRAGVWIDYR